MPVITLTDGDTSEIIPGDGDTVIAPLGVRFDGVLGGAPSDLRVEVEGQIGDLSLSPAGIGFGIDTGGADNVTVIVAETGVIAGLGDGTLPPLSPSAPLSPLVVFGEGFTLHNHGLIEVGQPDGFVSTAVYASGDGADILNTGAIRASTGLVLPGVQGILVEAPGAPDGGPAPAGVSLRNEGLIRAQTGVALDAPDFFVMNGGTIEADTGITIAGGFGQVRNWGTITSPLNGSSLSPRVGILVEPGALGGDPSPEFEGPIVARNHGRIEAETGIVFDTGGFALPDGLDFIPFEARNAGVIVADTGMEIRGRIATRATTEIEFLVRNWGEITASEEGIYATTANADVASYGAINARVGMLVSLEPSLVDNGVVANWGDITATRAGMLVDFFDPRAEDDGDPMIRNGGTISVASEGVEPAIGIGIGVASGFSEREGVLGQASSGRVVNTGTISGEPGVANGVGILLGSDDILTGTANGIDVINSGEISDFAFGIQAFGGQHSIRNTETISGAVGIWLEATDSQVVNTGTVSASDVGIAVLGVGSGIDVRNEGLARGGLDGISLYGFDNTVENSGTIESRAWGVILAGAGSVAVNTGIITTGQVGISVSYFSEEEEGLAIPGSDIPLFAGAQEVINDGRIEVSTELLGAPTEDLAIGVGLDLSPFAPLPDIVPLQRLTNGGDILADLGVTYSNASLTNTGTILGVVRGITEAGSLSPENRLELDNSGTIAGGDWAVSGTANGDRLANSGLLDGDVQLRGGDDEYAGEDGAIEGFLALGAGDDVARLGRGDDRAFGGGGDDQVFGGAGADRLVGGAGADELFGNLGNDRLEGSAGADRLVGGWGDDTLLGGADADLFAFGTVSGADVILDFETGLDVIALTSLAPTEAVLFAAISDVDGSAVIDLDALGGDGTVRLAGALTADLSATDFLL